MVGGLLVRIAWAFGALAPGNWALVQFSNGCRGTVRRQAALEAGLAEATRALNEVSATVASTAARTDVLLAEVKKSGSEYAGMAKQSMQSLASDVNDALSTATVVGSEAATTAAQTAAATAAQTAATATQTAAAAAQRAAAAAQTASVVTAQTVSSTNTVWSSASSDARARAVEIARYTAEAEGRLYDKARLVAGSAASGASEEAAALRAWVAKLGDQASAELARLEPAYLETVVRSRSALTNTASAAREAIRTFETAASTEIPEAALRAARETLRTFETAASTEITESALRVLDIAKGRVEALSIVGTEPRMLTASAAGVALTVFVASAIAAADTSSAQPDDELRKAYTAYCIRYGKLYYNDAEWVEHFERWKARFALVQQHNTELAAGIPRLELNAYADLPDESLI